MRNVRVGAAQMGAIQKADSRESVVERMIALLDQAAGDKCNFVVFPELTLTTFFPRWYYEDNAEADQWFEREMPGAETQPLFDRAKSHGIAISFGYAAVSYTHLTLPTILLV